MAEVPKANLGSGNTPEKSWSERVRDDAAREKATLMLAANEARLAARKQRRGTSVAVDSLAEARDTQKKLYSKMHKVGSYEFGKKDKLPDLATKKSIDLEGTTDASWFDLDKKRPSSWYKELADDANMIQNLRGHIKTNLDPALQAKMDKLIDYVVSVKNDSSEKDRFDHDKWNQILMAQVSSPEELLGSQGLYNYILAFKRAASDFKGGKTVGRQLSVEDFKPGKDGEVKFKSIKLNLASAEKGERYRKTVISAADKAAGAADVQAPKPIPEVVEKPVELDDEVEKASGRVRDALNLLIGEYSPRYNIKLNLLEAKVVKGTNLFTLKCDLGEGSKNFYLRVTKRGSAVHYSLSRVPVRGEQFYSSDKDAIEAFKAKVEPLLEKNKMSKASDEAREEKDFGKDMGEFFDGKYLKAHFAGDLIARHVDGRYAGGVEVNGAGCRINVKNTDYFVFVDEKSKSVELKMVREVKPNQFKLESIGKIGSIDLRTEKGKVAFAENIKNVIDSAPWL